MYFNSEAYDKLYPIRRRDELVSAPKSVESVIETFESKDDNIETSMEVTEGGERGDGRVRDSIGQ